MQGMTPDSNMNMGESIVGNSLANEFADAVGANSGPGGLPPDHQVCLCVCTCVFCLCSCFRVSDGRSEICSLTTITGPSRA